MTTTSWVARTQKIPVTIPPTLHYPSHPQSGETGQPLVANYPHLRRTKNRAKWSCTYQRQSSFIPSWVGNWSGIPGPVAQLTWSSWQVAGPRGGGILSRFQTWPMRQTSTTRCSPASSPPQDLSPGRWTRFHFPGELSWCIRVSIKDFESLLIWPLARPYQRLMAQTRSQLCGGGPHKICV